jgi:hypothetical protein
MELQDEYPKSSQSDAQFDSASLGNVDVRLAGDRHREGTYIIKEECKW